MAVMIDRDAAASVPPAPAHKPARMGLFTGLEQPHQALSNITPNWFASVMGTGIVATAAATLPVHVAGLRAFATVVWGLAATLLIVLLVATALHWRWHRDTARTHHLDPVMAHFYGAPPMAILTVGAGTLLLGRDVVGLRAATDVDWVLWFSGTIAGLLAALLVPYLQFTRHDGLASRGAFGGWLMSIVPPMVSASTGALLVPYAPAGTARTALLVSCYVMFGLALAASVVVVVPICRRLLVHDVGPARLVPTLWIVLGPLGQSITAVNLLGGVAVQTLPASQASALRRFGIGYGVPVWAIAVLWAAVAAGVTIRTAREHLPFSLTWWSFTFPVGTCVTGTTGLALHTGQAVFRYVAVIGYVALLLAWVTVALRTAHGSLRGGLLLPAQTATEAGPLSRAV